MAEYYICNDTGQIIAGPVTRDEAVNYCDDHEDCYMMHR
jgi:hypothetical protein